MSKYFNEEQRTSMSKYLDKVKKSDKFDKETTTKEVEYLINCLGDIELPESIIEEFTRLFHTFGGRYDVRSETETIKGLYDIYAQFPNLSKIAFGEITSNYINDLYEEYPIIDTFKKLIETFGENDDTFKMFMAYVNCKADELQVKYSEEAKKLDKYYDEYKDISMGIDYITYLKNLVQREHISADQIIKSLPESNLVREDTNIVNNLAEISRNFFGVCTPISYRMTRQLAKHGNLDNYDDELYYYISTIDKVIKTSFNKEQFLESVKNNHKKQLSKKKDI